MALSRISLTLLAAAFVSTISGQEYGYAYFHIIPEEQLTCTYKYVRLTLAIDEQTCAKACKKYSSKLNGPCFAYEYYPSKEHCEGYVFDIYEEFGEVGLYYTDFYNEGDALEEVGTLCEANHGVDLTPPVKSNSTEGTETKTYGCQLRPIRFGVRTSEEACRAACMTLRSNVYGGCAAWFYNLSTQACTGILSVGILGGNTVCGPSGLK